MMATPGIAPPIVTPPVRRADDVDLPDDAPVVGVVVHGKARAYALASLSPMLRHVVNDLIDEVPVSVTYCDLARCARACTSDRHGKPLARSQTGRRNDGLLLTYEGHVYAQATGQPLGDEGGPPLRGMELEETTWKAWQEKHVATEVYVGARDDERAR